MISTPVSLPEWFRHRGWAPFPFQEELWEAWSRGESGLLHAPTGSGKTLAVWGGALRDGRPAEGRLRYLWLTPLRALARDTVAQLEAPLEALGLDWSVGLRTGDTSSHRRQRQRTHPPTALVTTPESLSVLLSYADAQRWFGGLRGIVVDEWHELMGSKRGTQTELGLARLRRWNPGVPTWGVSATLGNLDEALETLTGGAGGRIVQGPERPPPELETLLPDDAGRFPWAGHLGLQLVPRVLDRLDGGGSTLLFTNTRSQAELWHRALADARPEWVEAGELGLHHGSVERERRLEVEDALRAGTIRCVVCTSSLDLGVDFPAVDRVIQVGSPKGIGRLLQRAGRSGHTPDGRSRILCVPTHAFEIVEFHAVRRGLARGRVEPRRPLEQPLDVLAQHLVTVALGGGFRAPEMLDEVRTTHAYRHLSETEWGWVLDFVTRGGSALQAYPRYHKVLADDEGIHRVPDRRVARQHRMSIGTITSDAQLRVRYLKGKTLGRVEEAFLARLRPGETFLFAGRTLRLVRIREMTAWVRRVRSRTASVPRWMGGRLPLSTELGAEVLETLAGSGAGRESTQTGPDRTAAGTNGTRGGPMAELEALAPLLEIQGRWSGLPTPDRLLVERTETREGAHLFVYPFLGRLVHEGMATILAWRFSQAEPRSIEYSVNDYGFELVSDEPLVPLHGWGPLLSPEGLVAHLLEAVNAAELARRQFREIARVAGLVFPGYPGSGKSDRQLQASSGLLFDVLARYDPDNLLLTQARREVLEGELNLRRLRRGLETLQSRAVDERVTPRLTPLAFPLWADRLHARVSSESWRDRVARMVEHLERSVEAGE
ncbi:MAG: ligase-associated DNA damage response DEXH box helicase [Gemmatimonadales bacterium]|nr:MAG: ligase-associated DNA damage response DEXH box helicase [Gemmatimonadales bacterium]